MQRFFLLTQKGKFLVQGEAGSWTVEVEGRECPVSGLIFAERGESIESTELRTPADFKRYYRLAYMYTEHHMGQTPPIEGTMSSAK